jgi:hypothetical protein
MGRSLKKKVKSNSQKEFRTNELTLTQTAGSYFSTQIAVTREFLVSFDQMMGNRLFSHPWWLVGVGCNASV